MTESPLNDNNRIIARDLILVLFTTCHLYSIFLELSANLPAKTLQAFKQGTCTLPSSNFDEELSDSGDSGFDGNSDNSSQNLKSSLKSTNKSEDIPTRVEGKKFECPICGKFFKRRSSLSTHKLIHLNVKPFTCQTCSKEFLRRSDLKKHSLMHSGKKPHECPECKKVFSQSSNMLTHMRRHTGVRPFSCNICGHAFYRKVDVRRHQSRHQKENVNASTITVRNKLLQ